MEKNIPGVMKTQYAMVELKMVLNLLIVIMELFR